MAKNQIQKVSWWHEQIVEWELDNPHRLLGDCAKHFEVTQSWLSTIRNSDAFIHYRTNRLRRFQGGHDIDLRAKAEGLAGLSLDVLQERIAEERETIGLGGVLDTANVALKALGFGVAQPPQAPGNTINNTTIQIIDKSSLEQARSKMRVVNNQSTAPALPASA